MTARQLQASRLLQATLNAVALGYFSPRNGIDGTGVLAQVAPEVTFNGSRVDKKSGKKLPDGIELRFQGYVPTEEVREKLKAAGFRFSEPQQMWYALDNEDTKAWVKEFGGQMVDVWDFSTNANDPLEPEKNYFWAKVRSMQDWKYVPKTARVMVSKEGAPNEFFTKSFAPDLSKEIAAGQVRFQKFFQRKGQDGEGESGEGEPQTGGEPQPNNGQSEPKSQGSTLSDEQRTALVKRLMRLWATIDEADTIIKPSYYTGRGSKRTLNIKGRTAADNKKDKEHLIAIAYVYSKRLDLEIELPKEVTSLLNNVSHDKNCHFNLRRLIDDEPWVYTNNPSVPEVLQEHGVTDVKEWRHLRNMLFSISASFHTEKFRDERTQELVNKYLAERTSQLQSSPNDDDDLELIELEAEAQIAITNTNSLTAQKATLKGLDEDLLLGYFGEEIGLPNKEVWLTSHGAKHIFTGHNMQLAQKGYTVESFVKYVFDNFINIFDNGANSYMLECQMPYNLSRHGLVAILISHTVDGNYSVTTGFIAKEAYVRKKKKIGQKGRHSASE